ncbi:Hypothetical predicted protein [Octopus vulgaris]|uniref:Uncharacterized protein n=1 Tax=Octopus vulgaris TaxID=6645 RepID=A0AA36B0Z0_OCTVU|nr:Hypothetical predicted protein [Octopus vulgaris]
MNERVTERVLYRTAKREKEFRQSEAISEEGERRVRVNEVHSLTHSGQVYKFCHQAIHYKLDTEYGVSKFGLTIAHFNHLRVGPVDLKPEKL